MEDILAIILIFGGGTLTAMSFSPVGRAVADRLRHGPQPLAPAEPDPGIYDELDRLRMDVSELQERVDFAERLLAKGPQDASETTP
ncbi:MAG: hypothetical protein ABJC19_09680 [Gemmatimonadota bacterium]